ncbi:ubiquitin-like-conjugating enzyme ATG10 isoform X2 [Nymphaea colorata]|uniref:ubiquitin-like-conjugating enzyme ATG10 isoform X2 n=1 Tax=Nymphaea colorata TaxID=210225 RepID=UPI00129EE947|nr:ubiquitin-like-conjugating enzyme ATG10 isoform X2 [Nymphaea colorata]
MAKELTWDGTLSPNEFQKAAKAFVQKWKGCISMPAWAWKPFTRLPYTLTHDEGGYLSLEIVYKHVAEEEGYPLESSALAEEVADAATLVNLFALLSLLMALKCKVLDCDTETHLYDFHIIYSASYRVPILYFRGYNIGGQPLDWSTIKEDLPLSSVKMLDESRWTFITKEEHPYLKRPWFTLHPCGTGDWMKLLFLDKVASVGRAACIPNYVLSWLSMVGQAVGLKVPLDLLTEDEHLPVNS